MKQARHGHFHKKTLIKKLWRKHALELEQEVNQPRNYPAPRREIPTKRWKEEMLRVLRHC